MNRYIKILKQLAKINGWNKHKYKSLKGQLLTLENDKQRNDFIRRLYDMDIDGRKFDWKLP